MKKGLQISKNWDCAYSFEELIARTEFIFKFDRLWDGKPILKLREPIEGMDLVAIDYDYSGICNGGVARFHAQFAGVHIEDLSKDVEQFVYDFLIKEKAIFNDKWQ